MKVHEKVDMKECWVKAGRPPVGFKWVETDKVPAKESSPKINGRFVCVGDVVKAGEYGTHSDLMTPTSCLQRQLYGATGRIGVQNRTNPFLSLNQVANSGHSITFDRDNGTITNTESGEQSRFVSRNGIYETYSWGDDCRFGKSDE